ncbi:MAG: DUF3413 domain-containing protein [Lentisphaeria bacterium]|nr:DUF3413 domain-containing protein [Lentisphaeria bacterium]
MKDTLKKNWNKFIDFFREFEFNTVLQFALLNGFLWMLMSIFYTRYIHLIHSSWSGFFYSLAFTVGHLGAFSVGLWLILLLSRFAGKKFLIFSAVFWSGLLTFLLFADIVVFSLYHFHINIPMLALFCSPAAFELVEFPVTMIITVLFVFTAIFVGEYFLLKLVRKLHYPKTAISIVVLIALCFSAFNAVHAWAAYSGIQEIILRTEALPLKYALTATRFFSKRGYKQAQGVKLHAGSIINYPLKKLEFKEVPKRKNVIFIVVDSMRADMMNPEVMPNISNLARKFPHARFMNHFSAGNCTKTGIFGLFYGIPGNYFDQALSSNTGAAMINSMVDLGYEVKTFAGGTLQAPPFNRTVFARVPDIELSQPGRTKVDRDIAAINKCIKFLNTRDNSKPCFVLLFLDSLHGSAIAPGFPQKFATDMKQVNFITLSNTPKSKKDALNLIRNSTYYVDDLLFRFFKKINLEKRIAEDTVVVITSDHGNEVGETDMQNWGHNSNFARYQTQVPLLIFGLNKEPQTINYKTSSLDVSATIMQNVLGCTNNIADFSYGKNLFDPTDRKFIFSSSYLETAIIYQDKIYVQTVYGIMRKYTLDGKIIDDPLPSPVIKEFLDMTKKYAK